MKKKKKKENKKKKKEKIMVMNSLERKRMGNTTALFNCRLRPKKMMVVMCFVH